MRQDKDRSAKWLLAHHGDAVLRLGGYTGFISWKPLQPETVAPRRLPDGLLEVRFPGTAEPVLVLVEIETYPGADADPQVLDDLMLIKVDRKIVPEVVFLVLKPKGNLAVTGASEARSPSGHTRLGGSWPVVRLWELEADALLATGDVGLVPWVPLTKTALPPEELMARCRDRLVQVPDPTDRAGLMAVTQILAGLAFPDKRFLNLFGGADAMIESPVLDEVKEILRKRYEAEGTRAGTRSSIRETLEARFGVVPLERIAALDAVADEGRLKELVRLAATCPTLDAFVAGLTPPAAP
jgi:hypothetical protein